MALLGAHRQGIHGLRPCSSAWGPGLAGLYVLGEGNKGGVQPLRIRNVPFGANTVPSSATNLPSFSIALESVNESMLVSDGAFPEFRVRDCDADRLVEGALVWLDCGAGVELPEWAAAFRFFEAGCDPPEPFAALADACWDVELSSLAPR